jgi:tripartite-type tricarboxylate transporter receptor subunit TctC
MELLKKEAALDLIEVPYKGGAGPAIAGLVAGETQVAFATVASVAGFIKAGRLKPIATLTEQRLAAFPQVQTMPEAGFPRIVDSQWQGAFAPRGTPPEIVERLHAGLSRIMRAPDTVERLEASSAQPYPTSTPAEFSAFVERETAHWAAIIKEVGAKATN